MLRFWLCTGHVASPAGDWAWWFYYDRWRKYSTHRHDNLCRIHSISHRMNARILLEERPPTRAAHSKQEDRKSVMYGKSVSVSVENGRRRNRKKKKRRRQ